MLKKLKFWWYRWLLRYAPSYRVVYPDGKRTFPLHIAEAKHLRNVYGGVIVWTRDENGDLI